MFDELSANILTYLALILASPFFLVSAVKQRRRRLFFHNRGVLADGIVMRVTEQEDVNDGYTRYVPSVSFMMTGQKWVTLPYEDSNLFSSFKTGRVVAVLYNPEDYTDFIILADEKPWIEIAFGVAGLIMLIAGLSWLTSLD